MILPGILRPNDTFFHGIYINIGEKIIQILFDLLDALFLHDEIFERNSVGTFFALQAIAFSSFIDQLHIIFIQPVFTFLQYFQDRWHTQIELIRQLLGGDLLPWPEMKEYF